MSIYHYLDDNCIRIFIEPKDIIKGPQSFSNRLFLSQEGDQLLAKYPIFDKNGYLVIKISLIPEPRAAILKRRAALQCKLVFWLGSHGPWTYNQPIHLSRLIYTHCFTAYISKDFYFLNWFKVLAFFYCTLFHSYDILFAWFRCR